MEIAGFVAMSHAPQWDLSFDYRGAGETYVAAVQAARQRVLTLDPDVLVVFGPDHFRNFFYDVMPPFCIGAEAIESFGDYGGFKGPIPGAPDLGRFVAEHVMADGFDPALSLNMGVDHGIAQPYSALTEADRVRVLPVMINCTGAAMASVRRCFSFGRAVGAAVRAFPSPGRAVVVGSGGLSHSPPSTSPYDPTVPQSRRDYAITGRSRAAAHNSAMEAKLTELLEAGFTGPVNPEWDNWFLNQITSGNLNALLDLTAEEVLRDGGVGGQEVRTWMAALGAWNGGVETSVYEPVPLWITGMGCVTAAL